jgi:hypothetical protein
LGTDDVDVLDAADQPPGRRWRWLLAAAVALAGVTVTVVARHPASAPAPATAPAPTPRASPPQTAAPFAGWLFLGSRPECVRSAGHRLRVAFDVTNLTDQSLHLVALTPVVEARSAVVRDLHVSPHACAGGPALAGAELAPSHALAVAITLDVDDPCRLDGTVAVDLTFATAGAQRLHVESSNLLTTGNRPGARCPPA